MEETKNLNELPKNHSKTRCNVYRRENGFKVFVPNSIKELQ
jgi:hypothetical protein